jgi:cytochrome c oxidase subunit II
MSTPPGAMEVYVVGKQWMWHLQHPEGGQREINELHVPVGRPVKLVMTSEDVIHSFFVPAFRTKQDVVPGRYVYIWFRPTKVGDYHLFCAQYCGTQHSRMVGWVHVMEPDEYQRWLSDNADESMAKRGRQLFLKYQCIACHNRESQRAPLLEELYGKKVALTDGRVVEANDDYIRRSIRDPKADIVSPFQPIMPTFGPDQMDDLELQDLVVFIKNLGRDQTPTRNEYTPAPEAQPTETKPEAGGKSP